MAACFKPVLDWLRFRNEKIEVQGSRISYYNRLGKKSFEDQLKNIELFRSGMPITTGVMGGSKRYIYMANGKYFNFSADIDDGARLLQILGE